jgi:hypothetical protein
MVRQKPDPEGIRAIFMESVTERFRADPCPAALDEVPVPAQGRPTWSQAGAVPTRQGPKGIRVSSVESVTE